MSSQGGTTTNSFPVTTGARQGCIFSPLLFLVVVDWVGKTAFNDPKGIGRILTTLSLNLSGEAVLDKPALKLEYSIHM